MSSIEKIDKNFAVSGEYPEGTVFYDAKSAPFKIYGIYHDGKQYRRMPQEIADTVNEGVARLCTNTAGGRVRFITDSPYVVIRAVVGEVEASAKMASTARAGFDMYERVDDGERYVKTFIPPAEVSDEYTSTVDFVGGEKERIITINFPNYNDVYELYIGLLDGSAIKEAPEYEITKPIVYYGSSVTQGGSCTRPGNSYQGMISRALNADYINLGFSGSARAEKEIIEYVSSLDMSVFVYDYDHNAPDFAHLAATHSQMFHLFREKHPTTPVILTTKPKHVQNEDDRLRHAHILANYEAFLYDDHDENVYFISGPDLLKLANGEGTVDGIHPNDLGFYSMAQGFLPILKEIFAKQN